MIVVISFMLIVFLAIIGYLMISNASSTMSGIIPYVLIFILVYINVFATSIIRLPLTIAIKDAVLTVEKLLSSKSFNRTQIFAFEVQTEEMSSYRGNTRWRHTRILRTYANGDLPLASQPSISQDAIEFKQAIRYLNRWLTS